MSADAAENPPQVPEAVPQPDQAPFDRCDMPLIGLLFCVSLAVLTLAFLSLRFQLFGDASDLHYMAFLGNEKGFVHYRDICDVNMFGVVALHRLVGGVFGYDDLGIRIFDLLWLTALLVCTWFLMRGFGWRVAAVSVVFFALAYLAQAEALYIQRDYLAILPIAAATGIAVAPGWTGRRWQPFCIGVLFGLAATLKPQLAIGLPLVAWFELPPPSQEPPGSWQQWALGKLSRAFWSGVGFAIPILAGLAWLWSIGAWPSFWEIVTQYYPAYTNQIFDGGLRTATAEERRQFVWHSAVTFRKFGDRFLLIIMAGITLVVLITHRTATPRRKAVGLLLAQLILAYYLQVIIVGNFHYYSWMPMLYFLILLTSVAFSRPSLAPAGPVPQLLLPLSAFLGLFLCEREIPFNAVRQLQGLPVETYWSNRCDRIVPFLQAHLQPGDKVQPLDWLGGTSRALLHSRAELATPFPGDGGFYYETRHPYVRELRRRFLEQMKESPPRFVIEVYERPLVVTDPNDDGEFGRVLHEFLATHYRPALTDKAFTIFERQ